ncbi:MAG: PEP-CTERM sorting domain-containing protein [Novosphingobium sp.]|nr:PEP-CTERM sorting domain-containing protein [Novosphingobium sp.]
MKKTLLTLAALGTVAIASPAMATFGSWSSTGGWGGSSGGTTHTHYCGCGDKFGDSQCNGSTGGSTGSTTSTTTTSTSSGNEVPEPGMLGLAGAGLIGLAMLRRRKARAKA